MAFQGGRIVCTLSKLKTRSSSGMLRNFSTRRLSSIIKKDIPGQRAASTGSASEAVVSTTETYGKLTFRSLNVSQYVVSVKKFCG